MENTTKTYRGYAVQTMDAPTHYFIALRETISTSEVSSRYETNFPKVFAAVQSAGLEMTGPPCGLFFEWDEVNRKAEIGHAIPIKNKEHIADFETVEVAAGKMLVIDFYGTYDTIGTAHYAMDEYMMEHNLQQRNPIWEQYVTDPTTEADNSKWLTKVYYPVQ